VTSIGYPRIHGRDDRHRLRRAWRALRATFGEYLRGRGTVHRPAVPAAPRHDAPTMFRYADATGAHSEAPLSEYGGTDGPATTGRESTGARHLAPRPSWSETTGGSLYDTLTGVGYESVERHETTGGIRYRTSLPPGRRPVGETSTGRHATPAAPAIGVRHSQVYDTGAHHRVEAVPDEGVNPMLRPAPPREVGGGRRRLDSRHRRSDGRPDLTVIPGEGFDDGWHRSDTSGPGRPNHLRAVPGDGFGR
jgi:hypothetical protein